MDTQNETDRMFMPGLAERVFTKEEADPEEVQRRELDVAEAAGLAAKAVQVTGSYMVVQGLQGPVDPISNWRNMTMPKAFLTPGEVRATCAAIRGRLEGLELDAQAGQEQGLPTFGPFALHKIIWTAAAPHWTSHQYRVAVREAGEALNLHWKGELQRTDVDDTVFWGQTLAMEPPAVGVPRLRWPGADSDKTTKSMREGLMALAKGLNLTVIASRSSADSIAVTPARVPSSMSARFSQRCRHDSETPKSVAIWDIGASPLRATATTSGRNSMGNALGMLIILPARRHPHRQGVN